MKLTVYRQSSKQRPDGQIIYKGEDARPYVGDNVLFVADGLGGASAIRHQKFKPELFDEDKILAVLFKDIPGYEDEILSLNEEYKKYIVNSFSEFTSIKNCYFDNIYNIKKSGYFASRIVAAIFLHDVLYDKNSKQPIWNIENGELFDKYNQAENKQEFLDNISKYITDKVKFELKTIAKNANLIYESSYSGLALLGTTLCATIFYEREDCVEALYFVAGDSRPYMWNDKGLFQVVEDQEGQDGGMTNYIKANDDGDFKIECKYLKFNKPCILFNASDGCFDSKYFISQMAFEKLILETIVAENDLNAVSSKLEEIFLEYGKHDDSSTIAMRFFGYENIDAIKIAAKNRLDILNKKYFETLPTLLNEDYAANIEEFKSSCPDDLKALKKDLENLPSVKQYCFEIIKRGQFDVYNSRVAPLDAKVAEYKNKYKEIYGQIQNLVERNYLLFANLLKLENAYKDKDYEKAEEFKGLYNEAINKYKASIEDNKLIIEKIKELLLCELEKISEVELANVQAFEQIDLKSIFGCKAEILNIQRFFKGLKQNKNETIKRLEVYRSAFYEKNIKTAKNHINEVKNIIASILANEIDLSNINIFDFDKNLIKEAVAKLSELNGLIEVADIKERNDLIEDIYPIYWERNYLSIMKGAIVEHLPNIGQELEIKVNEFLQLFEEKLVSLEDLLQKQKAYFDEYDLNYYSLIRSN